jgi:hypothetical protein
MSKDKVNEELELGKVEAIPPEGELRIHDASEESSTLVSELSGDIVFTLNNGCDEALRICEDGSFYVRDKKVIKDIEVYNGFVDFLKGVGCYKGEEAE